MTAVCQEHRSNPLTWTFLRWVNSTASKLENILLISVQWTTTRSRDSTKCESSSSRAWPRIPAATQKWLSVRVCLRVVLPTFFIQCVTSLSSVRVLPASSLTFPSSPAYEQSLTRLRRPGRGPRAQAGPGPPPGGAGHGHRRAGRGLAKLRQGSRPGRRN
jgi:hypothetical protein